MKRKHSIRSVQTDPLGLCQGKCYWPWPEKKTEECVSTLWICESGRNNWLGPLVVAAVYLKPGFSLTGLHDPDLLSEAETEEIERQLSQQVEEFETVCCTLSAQKIDEIGMGRAWRLGVERCLIELLPVVPNTVNRAVVDGTKTITGLLLPVEPRSGADRSDQGVALAKLLAQKRRRQILAQEAQHVSIEFQPFFHEDQKHHSKRHRDLIQQGHYTDFHRKSVEPLKSYLADKNRLHVTEQKELCTIEGMKTITLVK